MRRPSITTLFLTAVVAALLCWGVTRWVWWIHLLVINTSAMNTMRQINLAEREYRASHPIEGFTCSFHSLVGNDPDIFVKAGYRDSSRSSLALGRGPGYHYTFMRCIVAPRQARRIIGYTVIATPERFGLGGWRGYCTSEIGTVWFDPSGGTNCTEELQ